MIMSSQYVYSENDYVERSPLNSTVLIEENNVVWEDENDDCGGEETVDFADTSEGLPETTYMTADGNNTTQYFSLDASDDTILNDSTAAIKSLDVEQENGESVDISGHQVVLFKIDDSDDLYGVQVAQDDEGNFQKYQFKVRQNEDGNLEAVPESIQILPLDNEDDEDGQVETVVSLAEDEPTVIVKQEHVGEQLHEEHDSEIQEQVEEDEEEEEEDVEDDVYQEHVDTKEGILEVAASTVIQKQEVFEPEESISETEEYAGENGESYFEPAPDEIHEAPNYYVSDDAQEAEAEAEEEEEDHEDVEASEHYEELFVKESHLIEDKTSEEISIEPTFATEEDHDDDGRNCSQVESDNDYEIVDGDHVTGEPEEVEMLSIAKQRKFIKNVMRKMRVKKITDGNVYYYIKHPEKENVGTVMTTNRPNPRSVLKYSMPSLHPKKEADEKYEKRFAKSKEAQQARLFHNFIAQTKIIHAPVRQERLPRKQQIKPMERTDEEIVVQEVVVCSNGFIETSEEGMLKERASIKPTEFIQLSDSDEDYDPKSARAKQRKRKHGKRKAQIEITISDSDDWSDDSVIEIDGSDSEVESKRPRGRPRAPPKSFDLISDIKAVLQKKMYSGGDVDNNNVKKLRGRPPKSETVRTDNKCPKCPKSFPSEGSLRTHMQYHNFKESVPTTSKYECSICHETFKNNFLLTRHEKSHNDRTVISCTVCKKIFNDVYQLSMHKRSHIKQQMFKTTTVPKVSPKKAPHKKKAEFKCRDCDKILSNSSELTMHSKTHRRFSCNSCGVKFLSTFMLQNHLRRSCVKKKRTPNKLRPSFGTRRVLPQFAADPSRISVARGDAVVTNIKCDSCPMTFTTYTSLYRHKVVKHGLETPDNAVTKLSYKPRGQHSGVPPSEKMKRAFRELRNKLEK